MSKRVSTHDGTGVIAEVPGIGIMICYGTAYPADTSVGYATGCIFIHTDGGDNTALYVNEGTSASSDFNAVTAA